MRAVLWIAFTIWLIWGIRAPDTIHSNGWIYASLVIGAFLVAFLYLVKEFKPIPDSRIKTAVSALIFWFVLSLMIMLSLPKTYGLLPLKTQKVEATISSKDNTRRRRFRISFREYNCYLCEIRVSEKQWLTLKRGDKVELTGVSNWFGFTVKQVKLANK